MLRKTFLCVISVFALSCGPWRKAKEPAADDRTEQLLELYGERQIKARQVRDEATGWITRHDCDGMIWAGKYASTLDPAEVNIESAEYPDKSGKFGRRPPPWCWTLEGGDQGSKTEWSRDMAIAGLMPWAWLTGRRDVLERHAAYGRARGWFMGEPVADGRAYYTPAMRGVLYKTIMAMGGTADVDALWPSLWPAGLVDFEAHLQVMSIWLQGETSKSLNDLDAVPRRPEGVVMLMDDGEWKANKDGDISLLDISETMYQRLQEHATREPRNPLYAYVFGQYTGDQSPTITLLLDETMPVGEYVRCTHFEQCQLAEWLFVTSLLLRDLAAVE